MLRVSALVIAAVTAAGLYKKAWLPEKKCIRAGFFVYYTHLSNLLVLAYELALGIGGRGALRWLGSPGVALSVGTTNDSAMRLGVERRPRIRSPKRCTITPPPSILLRRAMLSP